MLKTRFASLALRGTAGLLLALTAGCSGLQPPPPKPPRSLPRLSMTPAPAVPGQGRVAITAVGVNGEPGPFWVEEEVVGSANVYLSQSSHVCAQTPCVANLPYGNRLLRVGNNKGLFGNVGIVVGEKPTVVNIVVGCSEPGFFTPCFQDPAWVQWEPDDGVVFTKE